MRVRRRLLVVKEAAGSLMQISRAPYDFEPMHRAVQSYVDRDLLVGAVAVVLDGTDIVDVHGWGHRDREAGTPMTTDSVLRIYSNTKPITSVAALTLFEDGKFQLDDPLSAHLPQFEALTMLRPGTKDADDVLPAPRSPTIRELFCHNGGFSYGIFLESVVDAKYTAAKVFAPETSLAELTERVARLPLANAPGARWRYSLSTDLLARLVEVWSGESFGRYLDRRIFAPLGMNDTGFTVRPDQVDRFAANYVPVVPMDPMKPGLNVAPDSIVGDYTTPRALESGGGGLVSTIADYTRFVQMIVNDGTLGEARILKPATVALMRNNALPPGIGVQLPNWHMPNTVFGHGFAIKTAPAAGEPPSAIDEYHWGGLAGTHSWMSPRSGVSGIIFTQRLPGFWHPFSHDFKREVYRAVG